MKFDAIIIGGGLAGSRIAAALQKEGLQCAMVAEGLSIHNADRSAFEAQGGYVLAGDRAEGGVIADGLVRSVGTANMGPDALQADIWVLATGKFFGRGIAATMDSVYEPVFGLDVAYEQDRAKWFDADFSAPQPFLEFGLKTQDCHPLKDGKAVKNLYAAGEVLEGVSSARTDAASIIEESADKAVEQIKKER